MSVSDTGLFACSDSGTKIGYANFLSPVGKHAERKKRMNQKRSIDMGETDQKFCYDKDDLGVTCSEQGTVFKVWSPYAKSVQLRLFADGETSDFESRTLVPDGQGTWKYETEKNLHGTYYDYLVSVDKAAQRTADPYAVGCNCNGSRSLVVDLQKTNPEGFLEDRAPLLQTEQIIYELHVKDFSYDKDSGIPEAYRGKFMAFTVEGTNGTYPTCLEYLKRLGITHVHLLPVFDFGALDEAGDGQQYNWGYDPVNYNVPEGSYSTDPFDGLVRITECKRMIQALHRNGIRVIMDVVYNHTYQRDSWLERMVPGYYYRHWQDGSFSEGSGCGNDIAAGRAMVDNYIVHSVLFWAREYHVDGFRFDLMGLLTVELMNRIRRELDAVFGKGEKLLYGEPWRAGDSPMEKGTRAALKENVAFLDDGISVFSDDTRDRIKGDVFCAEAPGFVNGGHGLEREILRAVSGWQKGQGTFRPRSCAQILQYVSAHDNYTLWDKLVLSMHGGRFCPGDAEAAAIAFTAKDRDLLAANKLAAFLYCTCQGNLFLQAGEEFGRTKYGDDNSYRSWPECNMLRWHQTVEFADLVEYYRGLFRLRRQMPGLCDKSPDAAKRIRQETVHSDGVVSFVVENQGRDGTRPDSGWKELFIVYHAGEQDICLDLPDGDWEILVDGEKADCRKKIPCGKEKKLLVKAKSGMMLGRIG